MINKAMNFARDIFAGDASGHDFDHTLRVFHMATRLAMEEGADLSTFPDEDQISTSGDLKDALAWANAAGIINGKASGGTVYLAPKDKATRAEAASMITSFHKKFA